jgi:hypothetical protein
MCAVFCLGSSPEKNCSLLQSGPTERECLIVCDAEASKCSLGPIWDLAPQKNLYRNTFNPFVTSGTYISHLQRVFSSPLG